MRIRFLSAIEPGWSFYRDLLPFLRSRGFDVELMITDVDLRGGRPSARQAFADSAVRLQTVPVRGGRLRRTRPWIYFRYVIGAMRRTLFGSGVDLNVFLTQPPLFALWGLVLRRLRGQKYAVILMDLYPDVLILAGLLKASGTGARLAGYLARKSLRNADAVLVIGRCMSDRLARLGVPASNIHLTHNWPSSAAIRPVPRDENPLRRELGLGDAVVILYSGNMGVSHYFDDILEVARRWRDRPEVRFVFVGRGARRIEIEKAMGGLSTNCLLLDFQPEERLSHGLGLGDVHFVCLRENFGGVVVPSKTYGAFAAGRPVVYQGNEEGEIARLILEHDLGAVVPLNSPDRLEEAFSEYVRQPRLRERQGERADAFSRGLGGRDHALSSYHAILQKVRGFPATETGIEGEASSG